MTAPPPDAEGQDRARRRRARRYGIAVEAFAALALRLKGYRIVARNFRTRQGEIDIIARRGDLVAIVEVKARSEIAAAVNAVGHAARRRIEGAAQAWLSGQRDAARLSLRFDIVAVQPWHWPVHIENAF